MNDEFERNGEFFRDGDDEEEMEEDRYGAEDGDGKMTEEIAFERIAANPKSLKERIDASLEILNDFKNRQDKRMCRSDVMETLRKDISEYYGYIPELAEFLLELFSPAECVEFVEASDRPRPLVIRANTLKTNRKDLMEALVKRGAVVESIEWSKVAIKVSESSVPIGATPEYLAGYYMLQSASSMNPVMALDPQPGERVLDMSAAPGGKTSFIAQMMKNSGIVVANDLKEQRQKATIANLHRLGVKNAIVCIHDGRKIPKVMKGFDRVLLDAPCSGLGVISRDQSVKLQRTVKDIQRIAHLQKELLCAAIDAVDPKSSSGGIIVYSTCSISCEENEQVVQYALSRRFVRLVDTGLTVGKPGLTRFKDRRFHPSLALTKRFYPHVHNMDGFYVAKLQKYKNGVKNDGEEDEDNESNDSNDSDNSEGSEGDSAEASDEESDSSDEEEVKVKAKAAPPVSRNNNSKAATSAPSNSNSKASTNSNIKNSTVNKNSSSIVTPKVGGAPQIAKPPASASKQSPAAPASASKQSPVAPTSASKQTPAPTSAAKRSVDEIYKGSSTPNSASKDNKSASRTPAQEPVKVVNKVETPKVVQSSPSEEKSQKKMKLTSEEISTPSASSKVSPQQKIQTPGKNLSNFDNVDDDDDIPIDRRRSSFGRKKHMKLRDMMSLMKSDSPDSSL